jgi:hypothetical protein
LLLRSLALFALAAGVASAAAIVNGNFETGDLTGWTVFTTANGTNGSGLPSVTSFDTTGSGASNAASFQVGQLTFPGGLEGGGIFQNVALNAGSVSIHVDFAAFHPSAGSSNMEAGQFELLLNGIVVASSQLGSIGELATLRGSFDAVGTATAGSNEIRIQVTRPFTNSTGTPLQYLDNISVDQAADPAEAPEPATWAVSVCGLIALVAGRRRTRNLR